MQSTIHPGNGAAQGTSGKPIKPLTKPEVRHLERAQAELGAYQDEKLDIYHRHHADMRQLFQQAREVRQQHQDKADERNQAVLDKLNDMKVSTDKEALRHQHRMKDFSGEFDASLAEGMQGWRTRFGADQNSVSSQSTTIGEDIIGVGEAIEQECRDCQAMTEAETGPIVEQLRQKWEFLNQQIADRGAGHDNYFKNLEDNFARLRKRLGKESQARQKECTASRGEAAQRYAELDDKLQRQGALVSKNVEELRVRLATEKVDRVNSHEQIVHNMTHLMEKFKSNVSETQQRLEATQTHLEALRTQLLVDNA